MSEGDIDEGFVNEQRRKRGFRPKSVGVAVAAFALLAVLFGGLVDLTAPVLVGLMLVVLAIVTVVSAVEVVDAYEKRALTVFGEYRKLLEPGINFVPPFVSKTYRYDMRTQTLDVPRQEAITRDNSPVTADAILYVRVMNAKKAFLEVDDYKKAVSNLGQTTLRAVLGDMELDDTLNRREEINRRIHEEIDEPTDEWGIRVESVEVREVKPSKDVQQAMEKQTSAERRRRAMILEAQGERRSAIEKAEGDKQSNIIRAQGEKQSQILEAQGDAISTVLRAKSAEAMGERAIIERGMESLEEIGKGESTTFVLPQELTSLVGRYGKHLSGSDVKGETEPLEALDFDDDTRELLGIEDIAASLEELEDIDDSDLSTATDAADVATEGDTTEDIGEIGAVEDDHDPIAGKEAVEDDHDPIVGTEAVEDDHESVVGKEAVEDDHDSIVGKEAVEDDHDSIVGSDETDGETEDLVTEEERTE